MPTKPSSKRALEKSPSPEPPPEPRRSARVSRASRERPPPAEDVIRIYTVDPSIPPRDRAELQEAIDSFHADPDIQQLIRELRKNTEKYVALERSPEGGRGYFARVEIPQGTPLLPYVGAIKKAQAELGNHELSLGAVNEKYPLCIAGKLDEGGMQHVNHACPPSDNCATAYRFHAASGMELTYLLTKRTISAGHCDRSRQQLLFPYQTRATSGSFWADERRLGPPGPGQKRVRCQCAHPAPCPNKYARNETPLTASPAPITLPRNNEHWAAGPDPIDSRRRAETRAEIVAVNIDEAAGSENATAASAGEPQEAAIEVTVAAATAASAATAVSGRISRRVRSYFSDECEDRSRAPCGCNSKRCKGL